MDIIPTFHKRQAPCLSGECKAASSKKSKILSKIQSDRGCLGSHTCGGLFCLQSRSIFQSTHSAIPCNAPSIFLVTSENTRELRRRWEQRLHWQSETCTQTQPLTEPISASFSSPRALLPHCWCLCISPLYFQGHLLQSLLIN